MTDVPGPEGWYPTPVWWKPKRVVGLLPVVALVLVATAVGCSSDGSGGEVVDDAAASVESEQEPDDGAPAAVGDIVDLGHGHVGRLLAIEEGAEPLDRFSTPEPGTSITRASVEACAGDEAFELSPYLWNAQDAENRSLDLVPGGQVWPSITIAPGGCARGTIDFQVPDGGRLASVFLAGAGSEEQGRWLNEGQNLVDKEPLTPAAPPAASALGVTTDLGGGATATVYEVVTDSVSATGAVSILPGMSIMRIDAEVCAGDAPLEANPLRWHGVGDGHFVADALLGAQQYDTVELAAGQCQRGTVDFEIPEDEMPAYVLLTDPGSDEIGRWTAN